MSHDLKHPIIMVSFYSDIWNWPQVCRWKSSLEEIKLLKLNLDPIHKEQHKLELLPSLPFTSSASATSMLPMTMVRNKCLLHHRHCTKSQNRVLWFKSSGTWKPTLNDNLGRLILQNGLVHAFESNEFYTFDLMEHCAFELGSNNEFDQLNWSCYSQKCFWLDLLRS